MEMPVRHAIFMAQRPAVWRTFMRAFLILLHISSGANRLFMRQRSNIVRVWIFYRGGPFEFRPPSGLTCDTCIIRGILLACTFIGDVPSHNILFMYLCSKVIGTNWIHTVKICRWRFIAWQLWQALTEFQIDRWILSWTVWYRNWTALILSKRVFRPNTRVEKKKN